MRQRERSAAWILQMILVGIVTASGCSSDPAEAARVAKVRADDYVLEGRLNEAILLYRKSIQLRPSSAPTHYALALAYEKNEQFPDALREFVEVSRLSTTNIDADLRVARALLEERQFGAVERLARRVLAQDSRRIDATVLLAQALRNTGRLREAFQLVNEAIAFDADSAAAHVERAALELQGGDRARALATLRETVARTPSAVDAWTALALLEWQSGRLQYAERAFVEAVGASPDQSRPRRALAGFYLQTGQAMQAERHLLELAARSPVDRLTLADYYLSRADVRAAEPLLAALVTDDVLSGAARFRMALLAKSAGRHDDANRELEAAIIHPQSEPLARLVRSQWLLESGDTAGALREATHAASLHPRWSDAHFVIGIIHRRTGNEAGAAEAFGHAREHALDPVRAVRAGIQQVDLALSQGLTANAVSLASTLTTLLPDPVVAAALARAHRADGDLRSSRQVIVDARARWPHAAILEVELGFVELQQRRPAVARSALERAMRKMPPAASPPSGFVIAEAAIGSSGTARRTGDALRDSTADEASLAALSASVDAAQSNLPRAERTLLRALDVSPHNPELAQLLADVQVAMGKFDEATGSLERVLARRPRSVRALTAAAIVKEAAGDRQRAAHLYERALSIDSKAGVAANNLAWHRAEDGRVDEALSLAITAELTMAGSPQASDTLGWMYSLKERYPEAIRFLTAAVAGNSANPVYHYHLGAVYARAGQQAAARKSLTRALHLSSTFDGRNDAQAMLEQLTKE
jgi:tetratricopeptide (TPR) repeat protein